MLRKRDRDDLVRAAMLRAKASVDQELGISVRNTWTQNVSVLTSWSSDRPMRNGKSVSSSRVYSQKLQSFSRNPEPDTSGDAICHLSEVGLLGLNAHS